MKAVKDIEKIFSNHSQLAAVSWRILFFIVVLYLVLFFFVFFFFLCEEKICLIFHVFIVVLYLFSVANKNLFKNKK